MAINKKGSESASNDGKADRRRLAYLKERSKDLKKEMQTLKTESEALRAKLGIEKGAKDEG
jgi:cell division protein FtsB